MVAAPARHHFVDLQLRNRRSRLASGSLHPSHVEPEPFGLTAYWLAIGVREPGVKQKTGYDCSSDRAQELGNWMAAGCRARGSSGRQEIQWRKAFLRVDEHIEAVRRADKGSVHKGLRSEAGESARGTITNRRRKHNGAIVASKISGLSNLRKRGVAAKLRAIYRPVQVTEARGRTTARPAASSLGKCFLDPECMGFHLAAQHAWLLN